MSESTPQGEIVLYQTDDGRTRLECRFVDESIWLTQRLIGDLFQISVPTVNEHLANVYAEGELKPGATIRKFRIVQTEGARSVSRQVDHYNLEAILAVGYRVRSSRGTAFRQWATARLSEYLLKGFTLDDARLKNPPGPGVPDYFDEMLEQMFEALRILCLLQDRHLRLFVGGAMTLLQVSRDYIPATAGFIPAGR